MVVHVQVLTVQDSSLLVLTVEGRRKRTGQVFIVKVSPKEI